MNKITINGVEIEFGSDVDVRVDGSKITISAKPTQIHFYPSYPVYPLYPHQIDLTPGITWSNPSITCSGYSNSLGNSCITQGNISISQGNCQ